MSAPLFLIASYPKSGNTWVRLIIENLRRGGAPVSINDIAIGLYGQQRREIFDRFAPAEASELLPDEIEEMLPDVYGELAKEAGEPMFLKVHDRLRRTPSGRWLFPPECVGHVIHVVRHPFDVAVSYARQRAVPVAEMVTLMAEADYRVAAPSTQLPLPLVERPGSWSGHSESWLEGAPYPRTLVRYEDLLANPEREIARIAVAAGLRADDALVSQVAKNTNFQRLKDEERASGFRERAKTSPAFFREGVAGGWIGNLDEDLRRQLVQAHGAVMQRLRFFP